MSSDPEKLRWAQTNVGVPGLEIREAMAELSKNEDFANAKHDVIEDYSKRMLFRALPSLMDETLSVEQLRDLDPRVTKVVFILLIRDFVRRFQDRVVTEPSGQTWSWVEKFTVELLRITSAPTGPYVGWIKRQEPNTEEDPKFLFIGLARQLGLNPAALLMLHETICEDVEEERLG
jgi:hypothetical protein